MKIAPRAIEAFLKSPGKTVRAALMFGPDGGLARERAKRLALTVVADLNDPFRVAAFAAAAMDADPAKLADEAAAISFTGGRRVIRIDDAGERHCAAFQAFLEAPVGDALIVVEAGDLGPRSKLRALFEAADNGAAIGCYADDAESLGAVIVAMLNAAGWRASDEARDYLVENLGADRELTRREIEKLIVYKGQGAKGQRPGMVTFDDCRAAIADASAFSLEDIAYAAADGDVVGLERDIGRVLVAGETPVSILRAVQRHVQRLYLVVGQKRDAGNIEQLIKQQRVHFRRERAFRRQVSRWSSARLVRALDVLTEAELDCKTAGMPDELICRRALLRLALAAGRPEVDSR